MLVSGVIQAGGQSRRMGGDPKALLELGGRRIIERVLDVLRQVTPDVLIVTNTPERYAYLGVPMVGDAVPGRGALGGIYSGLAAAPGDAALTVACDMPFLSPAACRLVVERAAEADVVIPEVAGQLEPLHACYGKACLDPMARRLQRGALKITGFFDQVRVLVIPESAVATVARPDVALMNVNTPEELARARALLAAEEPG